MKRFLSLTVAVIVALAGHGVARPCSMFTAHDTQTVMVAQNEDYYGEDHIQGAATQLWFVPAGPSTYGYVVWGFENNFSQGGLNDQGLFFDGFATPQHTLQPDPGTQTFTLTTLEEMLQVCVTVDEAIAFLQQYYLSDVLGAAQLMFVDASGDSAIFEGDVTVSPTANYQIATNFLQTRPHLGGYPCWRYDTVTNMMEQGLELTVDYFALMADAAHQGTLAGPIYTRYTVVSELGSGTFHLYYDLDWENPRTFVLSDELSQGPHQYWMAELFAQGPDAGLPDAGPAEADGGPVDGDATFPDGGQETGGGKGGGCSVSGSAGSPGHAPLGLPVCLALTLFLLIARRRQSR